MTGDRLNELRLAPFATLYPFEREQGYLLHEKLNADDLVHKLRVSAMRLSGEDICGPQERRVSRGLLALSYTAKIPLGFFLALLHPRVDILFVGWRMSVANTVDESLADVTQ